MKNAFPESHYLMELAKRNPEELERLRVHQINQLIDRAPEHLQSRLRGLQFQIDCKRRLHNKSPLGSCIEISRMMMDSLQSLSEALHGTHLIEDDKSSKSRNAVVLEYPKSRFTSSTQ